MLSDLLNTIKELRKYLKYFLWACIAIYLFSGVYTVSQNEVGILIRFGKVINANIGPGVNYHLPYPIDRVIKAPIQRINTMVIDDFSDTYDPGSTPRTFFDLTGLASYCITGDNNIVGVSVSIQYKIGNPKNYYFSQRSPERIIYEITANSIVNVLAQYDVDSILTFGKRGLGATIRDQIQRNLNNIDSGIDIYFIDINFIRPPDSVQAYFDDVINARIQRDNMLDEALSYMNTELSRASGERANITEMARAYTSSIIDLHTGEANRFLKRKEGFLGNRDLIIQDLFLEYLSGIFDQLERLYILDANDKGESSKLRFILSEDK